MKNEILTIPSPMGKEKPIFSKSEKCVHSTFTIKNPRIKTNVSEIIFLTLEFANLGLVPHHNKVCRSPSH